MREEEEIEQVETIEEEEFCSQDLIRDARSRRANNNQILQCDTCNFETRSVTLLTRHVETLHKQDDTIVTRYVPYKCNQCEYKTSLENELKTHITMKHKG